MAPCHYPDYRSAQKRNRNSRPAQRGIEGKQEREDGGHPQNRADREIYSSGQDDERHSRGEDDVNRRLPDHVDQVVGREKTLGEESEKNANDDQHRQHSCNLNEAAHHLFSRHSADGVLRRGFAMMDMVFQELRRRLQTS